MAVAEPPTTCRFCGIEAAPGDRVCGACSAPLPRKAAVGAAREAPLRERSDGPPLRKADALASAASLTHAPRSPAPPRSPWTSSASRIPARNEPPRLPPIVGPPRIVGLPEPWFFLLAGLVLAPVLTFTPILRYMGWFLGSLFHETGHAALGWLLGRPTVPAIRIDGHAAAIHGEASTLIRLLVIGALAALLVRVRARPWARVAVGLATCAYPVIAFTSAAEVAFLLAGHLGEAAFATVLLVQALDGGFSGTAEERATHAMVGWYLVGRNASLCAGLVLHGAARSDYAESGSFGLVNDYLRIARHLGVGLEPIALVMFFVALLPVPLAILLEHGRARRG